MQSEDARMRRAVESLEKGGRILVSRLQFLGDVILTLPLVDAIHDRFPEAEIDYLCRAPASGLLEGDSRLSRVFTIAPGSGAVASLSLIRRLRARNYAAAIDLYSNPRSAWLSRFSGAGIRIGGDRRGRRRLYTHPVTVSPGVRSAVEHHLKYAEPIDVFAPPRKPALTVNGREVEEAREMLDHRGIETRRPRRPRIGIHPGGKWEVKRWPTDSFAGLAEKLKETWDADIVVFTGPGEAEYADRLKKTAGDGIVVLPEAGVRTVAALLSLLDGMVVSDGGIMHLSVAVGTPTVGIFGSAEPDIWFPYESLGPYAPAFLPLDCRPCHRHVCPLGHTACLRELTPDMVLETLRRVMEDQTRPGGTAGHNG